MNFDLPLNIPEIKKIQRNRHPLLFVDQIFELIPGKFAKGLKNFTYNEWFFPAHFDDEPNVPGFIQVESLVQVFIMTFLTLDDWAGEKTNFLKMEEVLFKRKIIPGEQLIIEANLTSFKRGIAQGYAEGFVNNELACSAKFIIALPTYLSQFKPKVQ